MRQFIFRVFAMDDVTHKYSTSKIVRMLSFGLAFLFVMTGLFFIYSGKINITETDLKLYDRIGDFLIFLIPATESSYMFNKYNKAKHGLLTPQVQEENDEDEEPKRVRQDL